MNSKNAGGYATPKEWEDALMAGRVSNRVLRGKPVVISGGSPGQAMDWDKAGETMDKVAEGDDLHEFMMVLRRALLLIVRWIEKRYSL